MTKDSVVLVETTSASLTVSWPETEGPQTRYILEYRPADQNDDSDEPPFQLLSDKLQAAQARKRNLGGDNSPSTSYWFRSRSAEGDADEWHTHLKPFQLLTAEQEASRMETPTITPAGTNQALMISWKAPKNADGGANSDAPAPSGYELQMRENKGGEKWTTIAPNLSSLSVRKKNLSSPLGYQFRVRPSAGASDGDGAAEYPFSPSSDAVVARGLSAGVRRFFSSLENGTLLRNGASQPVPLADALGGKEFVLLYASAHWCPPCRKFTPMLAQWYQSGMTGGVGNKALAEVVFLSCDHDEAGFKQYFNASHPWMAVDYDDDAREQLLAAIQVKGIPRLVVMSGITGKIIVDNAVGQPLDIGRWRSIAAGAK